MKLHSIVSLLFLVTLGACATRQVYVGQTEHIPDNNFQGIVAKTVREPALFIRELKLNPIPVSESAKVEPVTLNYVWFYERNQTLGQHLDAWAHRFGYRFDRALPLSSDPMVKSDATFVGNLYAAIEDVSALAGQGRASFLQVQGNKKLYTQGLIITLSEEKRYLRLEQRSVSIEPLNSTVGTVGHNAGPATHEAQLN